MKTVIAILGVSLLAVPAFAAKPCDELKSEIAAKLDGKGVKNYQLEIVANAEVKDQTVVGSCDGGTKKITYSKGEASSSKSTPQGDAGAKTPGASK